MYSDVPVNKSTNAFNITFFNIKFGQRIFFNKLVRWMLQTKYKIQVVYTVIITIDKKAYSD